jgi:hypothetical protein
MVRKGNKLKVVYITFTVPHLYSEDEKFAIECHGMQQATEVGSDACSFDGITNVRLRTCGKPSKRTIMSYIDYWKYEWL